VIKGRGLLFLETRASNQMASRAGRGVALPHAVNDRDLDSDLTRAGSTKALAEPSKSPVAKDSAMPSLIYPITTIGLRLGQHRSTRKVLGLTPASALGRAAGEAKEAGAVSGAERRSTQPPERMPPIGPGRHQCFQTPPALVFTARRTA